MIFARSSQILFRRALAFSLVEVTLALGIIAFALIPLIGLLSVGLDSYHNAALRDRATQILAQLSTSIRQGTPVMVKNPSDSTGMSLMQKTSVDGNPEYCALPPYHDFDLDANRTTTDTNPAMLAWGLNGSVQSSPTILYYDESGVLTTVTSQRRLMATIVIEPPTSTFDQGSALIVVSWPASNASPPVSYAAGTVVSARSSLGTVTFKTRPQGHVETNISFVLHPL